jgi:hypothetical protein
MNIGIMFFQMFWYFNTVEPCDFLSHFHDEPVLG